MKKTAFLILTILLLVLAVSFATADGKTTVLVYMCGTDIQDDACGDLKEMAKAATGDNVELVVMAGGAKRWSDRNLKGNTRNLITFANGKYDSVQDVGKASMGSPDSLKEFLKYGLTNYPADRTIVILWNHGSGSEAGICFDETAKDDSLTMKEIDNVLGQVMKDVPGAHIDIFGCDACMMATWELAAVLSQYDIDCFVASEELEPGCGWFYTDWLSELEADPLMSNEQICATIVDTFMEASLAFSPDDTITLSAVDLKKVRELTAPMESFAAQMKNAAENGQIASIRRGRSRMYSFGTYYDGSWDMVDLGTVLDTFSGFDAENAAKAKQILQDAVIYASQTDNIQACSGLSVLIPYETMNEFGDYADGYDVSGILPNWVSFVKSYVNQLAGGSYTFSNTQTQQLPSGSTVCGMDSGWWDYDWFCGDWGWDDSDYWYDDSCYEDGWYDDSCYEDSWYGDEWDEDSWFGDWDDEYDWNNESSYDWNWDSSEDSEPSNPYDYSWLIGDDQQQVPSTGTTTTGWFANNTNTDAFQNITLSENEFGFSTKLTQDDLANLDYVESQLMMDLSDDEMIAFIDLGLLRDNLIDWQTGRITSLFDGTWPVLGGQLVTLYDQSVNDNTRRSLIPVLLNGEETYLVVVFPAGSDTGRIIGANAGYDDNGLPIRETVKLKAGDEIVPTYVMYYCDIDAPDDEDMEELEFEGDPIIWEDGMEVVYESLADESGETTGLYFSFVLNDIFGEYEFTDPIEFEI